ncbi:hypothetical protein I4U23_010540 [Adineta vaga]|nr:hypothetical protein I4U23_010540 [Adineta vaga]
MENNEADIHSLHTESSDESNKGHKLSSSIQKQKAEMKQLSRDKSTSSESFPVVSAITTIPQVSYISSPSSTLYSHYHSTRSKLSDQQSSIIDLKSHRSTILVWKDLTVSTREKKENPLYRCITSKNTETESKRLLHSVSGVIAGGLWAVMGPSGSGKSTLLNTLACRLDVNTVVEGEMRLNGAPYRNAELKRISGYVMQDDLLNGYLTVEETLMFTAELRLPRIFTQKQREERVEEALTDLNLVHVRHSLIGIQSKHGISGSERKRLCVGMQLLNRPQLLFLDEPTTGLDSVTALDLLYILHGLAHGKIQEKAITIVCSIHQPQTKIFNLFDSIILLKDGHIAYQGSRKQSTEIFRNAGFACPLYTNPADHILDVITPPKNAQLNNDVPSKSLERKNSTMEALLEAQPPLIVDLKMGTDRHTDQMTNLPQNPSWFKQVHILFRRNIREQTRKLVILLFSIVHGIIMGTVIAFVFFNIGTTQTSIVRREPVLFFAVLNQGVFAALKVINSYPFERTLILRERASGTYFASAYYIARLFSDLLFQLPVPMIFSCIVYFIVGFQPIAGKFFLFMLFNILCSITSTSMALMISALCRTTSLSVTILAMALEVTRLFGGIYIAPSRLPKYLSWVDALSYVKYTFVGVTLSELQGLKLSCQGLKSFVFNATYNITETCIHRGEELIQERGYDYINIGGCIAVLLSFIVFYRTIAFLGVRFLKH